MEFINYYIINYGKKISLKTEFEHSNLSLQQPTALARRLRIVITDEIGLTVE